MKSKRIAVSLLLIAAIVFALFACGKEETPSAASSEAPAASDTSNTAAPASTPDSAETTAAIPTPEISDGQISLTIGVTGYLGRFLSGLSPADNQSACEAVFDFVFQIDPKTKEIYSDTLEEYHWDDDTHLTLTLKDGIYFSNGDKATSEDLLFSYMQHLERGSAFVRNMLLVPDGCKIIDDFTIQLELERKDPGVLITPIYLYSKKWADSVGWDSEEWYKPVGSGPYYVAEYVYDDYMILRLRDEYWARSVDDYYINEYVIKYYADSSTLYMALERGDIDCCGVDGTDYGSVLKEGGDGFNVVTKSNGVTYNFYFGYQEFPEWKNKSLRLAVAYGVNWEELGQLVNGDLYVPANSTTPTSGPYYYDPGTREYNIDLAKQYLEEAGYAPGELTLGCFLSDQQKTFGEAIKYYLDEIGINTDIQYGDSSAMLSAWTTLGSGVDFCMHMNVKGSPDFNPAISTALLPIREGVTFGYVDDEKAQELYAKMSTSFDSTDTAYRKQVAADFQQYIYDEALIVPFAEYVSAFGYRTDKLTAEQINDIVLNASQIQLSKLGLRP